MKKPGAALLWLSGAVGVVFSSGLVDDGLRIALHLLTDTESGRTQLTLLLTQFSLSFKLYGVLLKWAAGVAVGLAVLAVVPLCWRALRRFRPTVFISFQHAREELAIAVAEALSLQGFRVRRVPFEPGADHQQIVGQMQRLQRGADALVCLPGDAQSAVDAEVYAAAVALQPVIFLVKARGGSLPNAADKRYPVMRLEVAEQFGWAPLAELLHHVTGDFRSTLALYARAMRSPLFGMATAPVLALLLLVLLVLCGVTVVHGLATTSVLTGVPALLRAQAVAVQAAVLTLGALPVLALTAYLALVVYHVAVQFTAALRASLRAGEAAFRREDWVGLIPGLEPGQALYLALMEQAPLAHHERLPKPRRLTSPRVT